MSDGASTRRRSIPTALLKTCATHRFLERPVKRSGETVRKIKHYQEANAPPLVRSIRGPCTRRVPRLGIYRFLGFLAFNKMNNLRIFSVAFSSIPTAPTNKIANVLAMGV
jgi:hypothetical protein